MSSPQELIKQLDMNSVWDERQPEQTIPTNHDVVPYMTPREIVLRFYNGRGGSLLLDDDECEGEWDINTVVSRALQELNHLSPSVGVSLGDNLSAFIFLLYGICEDLGINLDELTNKAYWDG